MSSTVHVLAISASIAALVILAGAFLHGYIERARLRRPR